MIIKIKEQFHIKGQLRIKTYKAETKELLRMTEWIPNLIVLNNTRGINLIIRRLGGNTTYDIIITKAKIGVGTTPPTNSDTDLENPTVSNIPVAQSIVSVDETLLSFFISDTDLPNGTYTEFGAFVVNQMFSRTIINPSYSKGSGEDTNIEYKFKGYNT